MDSLQSIIEPTQVIDDPPALRTLTPYNPLDMFEVLGRTFSEDNEYTMFIWRISVVISFFVADDLLLKVERGLMCSGKPIVHDSQELNAIA